MDTIHIIGKCGATLVLPYPDEMETIVCLSDIFVNFKDVLNNPDALQYLFSCEKVLKTDDDVRHILFKANKEVIYLLFDNEEFMRRRESYLGANEAIDNVVARGADIFSKMMSMKM